MEDDWVMTESNQKTEKNENVNNISQNLNNMKIDHFQAKNVNESSEEGIFANFQFLSIILHKILIFK